MVGIFSMMEGFNESQYNVPNTIYARETVSAIWSRIREVHSMYYDPDIVKKAFLIYGESGEGKTHLLKQYKKLSNPVRTLETTTKPIFYYAFRHAKKSTDEITKLFISELGAPVPKGRVSSAELEQQLITLLRVKQVELIMLDEIQNLVTSYDGLQFQSTIKYFCWLIESEDIKCSVVFAGTDTAQRLLTFGDENRKFDDSEQLSRRMMRPLHIGRIRPRSAEWLDCVNWFLIKIGVSQATPQNDGLFLDRVYLAYQERSMSTLRDLFFQDNSKEADSLAQLTNTLHFNFEKYGKGELNPFSPEDITDDEVKHHITTVNDAMKSALNRKLKSARARIAI